MAKAASTYSAARKRQAKANGIVWRHRPRDNSKEQRGGQIVRDFRLFFSSAKSWRENRPRKTYPANGLQERTRRLRQMGAL